MLGLQGTSPVVVCVTAVSWRCVSRAASHKRPSTAKLPCREEPTVQRGAYLPHRAQETLRLRNSDNRRPREQSLRAG